MSRIIKLTESQLRDVVAKVISEQATSATPQQIWDNLSIAQAGMGGAGGTDEKKLISTIAQITSVDLYRQVVALMGAKSIGNYKSIIQLLNGELEANNYGEFQQIQSLFNKVGIKIIAQTKLGGDGKTNFLVPGSIKIVGQAPKPGVTPKPDASKPQYRECTGFPIKYGCKQTEVGRLQQCLGLKVDYSFGPNTLVKLVDYSTQRNTPQSMALQKQYVEIGVSKGAYDLILQKCKKSVVKTKQKSQTGKLATAPVVDTRTAAPQRLTSKDIKLMPTTDINKSVADKLQNLPSPGVDNARKLAILGQIIDRGFDQVYKGQILTPEEQAWLNSYMGGGPEKSKLKDGGNAVKQVFNK
jgi:hypothetical protein